MPTDSIACLLQTNQRQTGKQRRGICRYSAFQLIFIWMAFVRNNCFLFFTRVLSPTFIFVWNHSKQNASLMTCPHWLLERNLICLFVLLMFVLYALCTSTHPSTRTHTMVWECTVFFLVSWKENTSSFGMKSFVLQIELSHLSLAPKLFIQIDWLFLNHVYLVDFNWNFTKLPW